MEIAGGTETITEASGFILRFRFFTFFLFRVYVIEASSDVTCLISSEIISFVTSEPPESNGFYIFYDLIYCIK